jgi:hypothetical protein
MINILENIMNKNKITKPYPPKEPKQFHCQYINEIITKYESLADLIKSIAEGVDYKDVEIYLADDEWDAAADTMIGYSYTVENENYKIDLEKYQKDLLIYEEKLKEYKLFEKNSKKTADLARIPQLEKELARLKKLEQKVKK